MKRLACIGLAAVLILGTVGCSKKQEEEPAPATEAETAVSEEASTESVDAADTIEEVIVTEEELLPFVKAFFSFSEDDLEILNRNEQIDNEDYFNNIKIYREKMKTQLGKYLSDETLKNLDSANAKLDFDLPKKAQINEYIANASGEVKGIKILSNRTVGDDTVYEIEVTSVNQVMPVVVFEAKYEWDEKFGYYVQREDAAARIADLDKITTALFGENKEMVSYTCANALEIEDEILIKSRYQVYLKNTGDQTIKIDQVKRAATIGDDFKYRQNVDTTSYIERVPYYEEVSASEQKLLNQLFKALMTSPKETYLYYNKIHEDSFDLVKSFWNDLGFVEKVALSEVNYKEAFETSLDPYKDQIYKLKYDPSKLKIAPSIYGTKVQPSFMVTVPMEAVLNDNTTKYYQYKYYVGMEEGKIETIKFLKMLEITAEEYESNMTAAEAAEMAAEQSNTEEAAEADTTAQ